MPYIKYSVVPNVFYSRAPVKIFKNIQGLAKKYDKLTCSQNRTFLFCCIYYTYSLINIVYHNKTATE